jgi:hypothetical protein
VTGDALLEIAFGTTPDGGPRALRVTASGCVELRGDLEAGTDAGGRERLTRVDAAWREQWTLTGDEVARLGEAVAAADDPPLEERYGPVAAEAHAREVVFRLRTPDRLAEVSVVGWPDAAPERLRELYRLVYTVHEEPEERSVWRMWTGSGLVERVAEGTPEDDPVLAAVSRAVFRGGGPSAAPEEAFATPPAGTPLVEIAWGGEAGEVTRVHADGRQEVERDGKVASQPPLDADALRALRDALRRAGG